MKKTNGAFVATMFVKIGGNRRRIKRGMRGGWGGGFSSSRLA